LGVKIKLNMYSKVFLEENNGFILCRDDLFPKYYGGNKARKLEFIENDIKSLNNNAVVTTGGIQSNHCRVVALMCAKNKWKCSLVLHGDKNDFYRQTGNAAIMRMCGADVQFVAPNKIGQCMSDTMKALK